MIPEFVSQDDDASGAPTRVDRGTAADLLRRGQAAARGGDRVRAARLLQAALIADPSSLEARLWRAAIADDPEESLQLLTEVLHEQPEHPRALAGLRWACNRLEARAAKQARAPLLAQPHLELLPETSEHRHGTWSRVILAVVCLAGILTGVFVAASYNRAEAERLPAEPALEVAPANLGDTQMIELPPLYTPVPPAATGLEEPTAAPPVEVAATATLLPTAAPPTSTPLPTAVPPTATPVPTAVPPTATPVPTAVPIPTARPTAKPALQKVSTAKSAAPARSAYAGKWIEVILSKQLLIAWQGQTPVRRMIVSTGVRSHPTVVGTFRIYAKIHSQAMSGPGYYLPNVPHVMYFYRGYAIHGTYWHNRFGTPMSHGCVNLRLSDAAWIFSWAGPWLPPGKWAVYATAANSGTLVVVHW